MIRKRRRRDTRNIVIDDFDELFSVLKESIVSMLEQLPGAHQVKQYSFKYNPPFDISSLEGTAEQVRLKVFLVDSESIYTKII